MQCITAPSDNATLSELADLAEQINAAHFACEQAVRSAITHAKDCGDVLLQVKNRLGHGSFTKWIAKNCKFSERQARRYMLVANNWDQLFSLTAKRTRVSDLKLGDLSVREALRIINGGKPRHADHLSYVDQVCEACGAHLAITSRLYVTCVECWDCRLWPNPHGRLCDHTKGETVIRLLSSMDDETIASVVEQLSDEHNQHRQSTRENVAKLITALQEGEK